jgi:hypothetical protein
MTTFCLIEGTLPTKGRIDTFLRQITGSPNDLLASNIIRDDLIGLSKKLRSNKFDINDPLVFTKKKNVNYAQKFWRSPLELAIDCGSSAEMVVFLLQNGAEITPPALKLAIDGVLVDPASVPYYAPYDFANAEKIVEVLSSYGAQWDTAFYANHPQGRDSMTPLDVITRLGETRAAEMGITKACVPAEETPEFTNPDHFIAQQRAERQSTTLQEATAGTTASGPRNRF